MRESEGMRECEGETERERRGEERKAAGEYHGSRVGTIWEPDISAADAVVTSKTYYVTKPRLVRETEIIHARLDAARRMRPGWRARFGALLWRVARALPERFRVPSINR